MAFEHIYTGKNETVTPPTGERLDRVQQNISNLILDAEKIRLDAYKKNEDWFLKTTDVPVESFINAANTEAQAKLLEAYKTKAFDLIKARGGINKLTMQDKLELSKGNQVIQGEQDRMLGDKAKYDMAVKCITANPDKYSLDKFQKIMAGTYEKNGRYPDVQLPLNSISPIGFYNKASNKLNGTPQPKNRYSITKAGRRQVAIDEYSGTESEAREKIAIDAYENEALREGYFDEFQKLDEKIKWKYLKDFDTDNSGDLDEDEMSAIPAKNAKSPENPIIRFAQDRYWPKAIDIRQGKPKLDEPKTIAGAKAITIGTKKSNPITLSKVTYNIPYEFDGTHKVNYIPTVNAKELSGLFQMNLIDETNVKGYLKLYDEEKDVFVFVTAGKVGGVVSGTLIEVPASDLREEDIKDIPVIVDGKRTTVEQVRANRTIQAPAQTTKDWSKYKQ